MAKYKNFAELKINDFRAIKSADINLNGITVVSGINGCGKTTMSKTIENIYSNLNDFEKNASLLIKAKSSSYQEIIDQMAFCIGSLEKAGTLMHNINYSPLYDCIVEGNWAEIEELMYDFKTKTTIEDNSVKRAIRILQDFLDTDSDDINCLTDKFHDIVIDYCKKTNHAFVNRDYSIFEKLVRLDNEKIAFAEYGEPVYGVDIKRAPLPYTVRKVFYIDSPLAVNFNSREEDNLLHALKHPDGDFNKGNESIAKILSFICGKSILDGYAYYDKFTDKFYYKSKNITIELTMSATGVKSFSIIQMLLNNGHLTDRTLLIIDEPEAHLHPQWIVEYAKLIVMLHKELGVKFFIASHNPDLVQSIKYLSEVEGVLDSVNFYIAEKESDDAFQYIFKNCEGEIDPLFESFNMSYKKLDSYVYANTDSEISE